MTRAPTPSRRRRWIASSLACTLLVFGQSAPASAQFINKPHGRNHHGKPQKFKPNIAIDALIWSQKKKSTHGKPANRATSPKSHRPRKNRKVVKPGAPKLPSAIGRVFDGKGHDRRHYKNRGKTHGKHDKDHGDRGHRGPRFIPSDLTPRHPEVRHVTCRRGIIRHGTCYCPRGDRRRRLSGDVYACVTRPLIDPPIVVVPGLGHQPDDHRPYSQQPKRDRDRHDDEADFAESGSRAEPPLHVALPPLPLPNPGPEPDLPAELFDAPHEPGEVVVFLAGNLSDGDVAALAGDYGLRSIEGTLIAMTGQRIERLAIEDGRSVAEVTGDIASDPRVISAQPNLLYRMHRPSAANRPAVPGGPDGDGPDPKYHPGNPDTIPPRGQLETPPPPEKRAETGKPPDATAAPSAVSPPASLDGEGKYSVASGSAEQSGSSAAGDELQYALAKISIPAAHDIASGRNTLVAIIDTGIEATHPELQGAVTDSFDAIGKRKPAALDHGTAIAGIVSAHNTVRGVAPEARLLDVRAFYLSDTRNEVEATTYILARGVDWAFSQGARIFNMSFAGPHDPALEELTSEGHARGAIFIAAAGNEGPEAAPVYPAAYRGVIAITATDQSDRVYAQANRGRYITAAAPGVDILVLAPKQSMNFSSGTSMAAAHAAGVAALLHQRSPAISPSRVREILVETAQDLGPEGFDEQYGAGRIDAAAALVEVSRSSSND